MEYDRIILCQTANDMWKNILNFHQENVQAKDDENKLLEKHLVEVDACTTSSNIFDVGNVADKDHISNLESVLIYESWSDTDGEDNMCLEYETNQKVDSSRKVHSKSQHSCYDPFILEFSKIESELNNLCNISRNRFWRIKL